MSSPIAVMSRMCIKDFTDTSLRLHQVTYSGVGGYTHLLVWSQVRQSVTIIIRRQVRGSILQQTEEDLLRAPTNTSTA